MRKISKSRLPELYAKIAEAQTLYAPIKKGGQVNFDRWSQGAMVRLDQLKTIKSAKDFFFPPSENLMAFKRDGKQIEIIDNRDPAEPFVVLGVRGCDVKGLDVLDKVYLIDPVDTYYQARREQGTVVSIACSAPEETCFCGTFGIDATEPTGDVAAWLTDDALYWDARTEKGEALTGTLKDLFEDTDDAAVKQQQADTKKILELLPLNSLNLEGFNGDALHEKFNSDQWASLSEACIACGTCTYVCPTCQCYDIQDFDTGNGIQRFRCWDSCMYSDFTLMAHGNPRTSQLERFRQRFMHKLIYFPANNDGEYSCVGCGRCVAKCPISMNIAKVIKALGVEQNA